MSTILCFIAIAILSAGIIIPRWQAGKLDTDELNQLEKIKRESRKFFFLSLTPLVLMAIMVMKTQEGEALYIYQIPAASVVIDMFCLISIKKIIPLQNRQAFRFVLISFISLAITKLLLFLAFFTEMKDAGEKRLFFDYL